MDTDTDMDGVGMGWNGKSVLLRYIELCRFEHVDKTEGDRTG
jgi:hypothetical protein